MAITSKTRLKTRAPIWVSKKTKDFLNKNKKPNESLNQVLERKLKIKDSKIKSTRCI